MDEPYPYPDIYFWMPEKKQGWRGIAAFIQHPQSKNNSRHIGVEGGVGQQFGQIHSKRKEN